eukprot:6073158-Amphidinium_carterae.1
MVLSLVNFHFCLREDPVLAESNILLKATSYFKVDFITACNYNLQSCRNDFCTTNNSTLMFSLAAVSLIIEGWRG